MKILFLTSTRIGDAVLSTGLLSHLVACYPSADITVACGTLPAPIFNGVPGVTRIIPIKKNAFLFALAATLAQININFFGILWWI